MKKALLLFAVLFTCVLSLTSCKKDKEYQIISTCFAGYDFAKNVAGDEKSCGMLLNPGEELHDYSPSISDVESIINSEVFIYIGGESDEEWVEHDILPEINTNKTKVINMMEVVEHHGGNTYEEEEPESAEPEDHTSESTSTSLASKDILNHEGHDHEEGEYDEHIWNSITNAKLIIEEIAEALAEIDSENAKNYTENKNNYVAKLNEVDNNIKEVVKNATIKTLIFADRFPLLYFVKEYGLEYDAAFKGCDSSKDASTTTIEKLINKVISTNSKVIFVIELSESNIANTIKSECKTKGKDVEIKTFYTMHNVSKSDYKKGTTYVDFMNLNIESLKVALN
ncbi:MAG: metal ABC transporter substrate-binding protein [Acholeplasmatales bacterium]|nr:metal ABC transporter substrate-binding protein [Acholeplasmatales bacterium]